MKTLEMIMIQNNNNMRKIVFIVALFMATVANATSPIDSARSYVNSNIVTNGSKAITGLKMNTALNGIIDAIDSTRVGIGVTINSLRKVDTIYANTGADSLVYKISGVRYAIAVGGGGAALSDITAATTAHTINNAAFQQEWKWDSLSSGIGLKLSSSSTKAASNTQTIFGVYQSGANNTSTQTTYGAIFSNSKTGTLSTNIGGRFVASGANNNYAIEADNQIKVVNSGTGVRSISFWSSSGENARIGCGYNNAGYDHLEINNLATTGYTSIVFKTKNTEVARINDLGYFHIGSTANPSYPLQIDAVSAGFSVVTSHRILCNSETELGFTSVNNGGIAHFGSVSGANTAVISTGGTARMYITSTNVGIGTSSTPDASALLDLSSTTKGLSLPTMTATQASAIASPKKSLMIYVTDTNGTFTSAGWWGYNGTTWKLILAE